jgi:KaiC/GvpD/RAD55 family RecA-like ATPase
MKFLKTGIAGFDEYLQGGLPPKLLLLIGPPGSGNEIFARQIMYNKARQSKIAYFTINTTADSVKEDMIAYGWDITPLIENGNWKFINLKNSKRPMDDITSEIKDNRSIIIDSLSELLLTQKIEEVIRLIIEIISQNKQAQECQFLLLTEGMQDPKAEKTMQHFVEGVINFKVTWTSDSTVRHVAVEKMSGMLVPNRRLLYAIGKRGFVIETATRIT